METIRSIISYLVGPARATSLREVAAQLNLELDDHGQLTVPMSTFTWTIRESNGRIEAHDGHGFIYQIALFAGVADPAEKTKQFLKDPRRVRIRPMTA